MRSRSRATSRPRRSTAPPSSTSAAPAATRSTPPTPTDRSPRARSRAASAPTGRTSTSARRAARTCCSRSATAASRARSCRRTSSSGRTRATSRCSSSATPARGRRSSRQGLVLDLKEIRRDPEAARAALERRRAADRLDELLRLDARRRELLPQEEELRAEQNRASKAIGQAKQSGDDASEAIAAMQDVSARAKALSAERASVDEELERVMAGLPNLPLESSPLEEEVVREWGSAGKSGRDHLDLLGGLVDMESGAKLSGSRFAYLRRPLGMLELALVRWAMELLSGHGLEPVIPPVLVREEALHGTGFLPDTEQQIYRVADDDLYLAGTSEVALASIHRDEILSADDLPRRYAGFSSCFRREAGAGGKDTRGIFRVHQFDKVEMFSFVEPSASEEEHERILAIEEELMQALGIPYRVVNIAAWDLGASAAKKYDVEAWLPGQERYRELTSCSNTTDYQARRLNARYRPAEDASPRFVHTLNGTAVTSSRTIIAVVENGQQEDGSIAIPTVLHRFGAPETIPPAS